MSAFAGCKGYVFFIIAGSRAPRLLHHQLFSPSCRLAKLAGQRRVQPSRPRKGKAGREAAG